MSETNTRTIDELIDLPYSEMSEDEISLVVEWKAAIKARDAEYEQRMKMLSEKLDEIRDIHLQTAHDAGALLEQLTAHAIDNYKAVSNGEA